MIYKNTYVLNPLVSENEFLKKKMSESELPDYEDFINFLPKPLWNGREDVINCYWKAWELAYSHLRKPNSKNGFLENYIDTAYNENLFMWDTAFICLFGKYGIRAFDFQKTIDNFYGKQHPDGFICREIRGSDGEDCFHRYDPVSTGPNIFPWAEWEYYLYSGNDKRLEDIFAPLSAYYQWLKLNRTWPDGTYWGSGWASGMDNQPRLNEKYHRNFSHGHMTWLDACLQQILSGKILFLIGEKLERWQEIEDIEDEIEFLSDFVNSELWDDSSSFYYDRFADGALSKVKSIGAFWALLAGIVPEERLKPFIEHLENKNEFYRPHRIPSLSADHPKYKDKGRYWLGGVWAPTNYMVLKGLEKYKFHSTVNKIAVNHLNCVTKIFLETGTLWENYAPELIIPANPAKPDFVGWTGLVPIAVLFENVFGIKADVPNNTLYWNVYLLDEFGIEQYPFGKNGVLNIKSSKRNSASEKPEICIQSNVDFRLILNWEGGKEELFISGEKES